MKTESVTVINPSGLHARPASLLTREAAQFASSIALVTDDGEYNAKSILNVLSAGIACGTRIFIRAEGEDEDQAVEALCAAIESGLGE